MTGPAALPPAAPDRCRVCRRRAGMADAKNDRFGWPDQAPDVPVGELEVCPDCGLLACPDCLHERDCCEYAGVERADPAAPVAPRGPSVRIHVDASTAGPPVVGGTE